MHNLPSGFNTPGTVTFIHVFPYHSCVVRAVCTLNFMVPSQDVKQCMQHVFEGKTSFIKLYVCEVLLTMVANLRTFTTNETEMRKLVKYAYICSYEKYMPANN